MQPETWLFPRMRGTVRMIYSVYYLRIRENNGIRNRLSIPSHVPHQTAQEHRQVQVLHLVQVLVLHWSSSQLTTGCEMHPNFRMENLPPSTSSMNSLPPTSGGQAYKEWLAYERKILAKSNCLWGIFKHTILDSLSIPQDYEPGWVFPRLRAWGPNLAIYLLLSNCHKHLLYIDIRVSTLTNQLTPAPSVVQVLPV